MRSKMISKRQAGGTVAQRKVFQAMVLSEMIMIANFVLITVILQDTVADGLVNIKAFAGRKQPRRLFRLEKMLIGRKAAKGLSNDPAMPI